MGLRQLPPEKHPTQFKIMMVLGLGDNSSYGISKILQKSQSNIYTQMKPLEEHKYIISLGDYKYKLNTEKLFNDFIDYILEDLPKQFLDECKDTLTKKLILRNSHIRKIFSESIIKVSKSITDIKQSMTLEDWYHFVANLFYHIYILPSAFFSSNENLQWVAASQFEEFWKLLHKEDPEYQTFSDFKNACAYQNIKLFKMEKEIIDSFKEHFISKNEKMKKKFISHLKKKIN